MKKIYLFFSFITISTSLFAQTTYFQQNFSAGGNTSDYVSATPDNTKFNGISGGTSLTASITGQALEFDRQVDNSSRGYAVRTTDFSPAPTSLNIQFRFRVVSATTGGANAVKFYVGSGFSNSTPNPSNTNVYARFAIDVQDNGSSFATNPLPSGGGGTNSANFSDWQTITFILNKEGNALKYLTPAGSLEQQPIDTYDLWVGTTKVIDNQAVITSSQVMTDFRITFEDGISKVQFDDFLFRNISGTLPVELVSFTAKPAGKQVQLAWSTTSEREAARFVVERSSDLKEYTTVGEVAAKGTTDQRQFYGLTDESPLTGNNYYRLKQVDTDGSMHYSKIAAAVMDDETPSFELRGNPVERNQIRLVSRNLTNATYHLTTLTGQELAIRAEPQADQSLVLIPAQGLAPGVYLLRAQQGATRLVQKIVVR